jgi:hypothetical protein
MIANRVLVLTTQLDSEFTVRQMIRSNSFASFAKHPRVAHADDPSCTHRSLFDDVGPYHRSQWPASVLAPAGYWLAATRPERNARQARPRSAGSRAQLQPRHCVASQSSMCLPEGRHQASGDAAVHSNPSNWQTDAANTRRQRKRSNSGCTCTDQSAACGCAAHPSSRSRSASGHARAVQLAEPCPPLRSGLGPSRSQCCVVTGPTTSLQLCCPMLQAVTPADQVTAAAVTGVTAGVRGCCTVWHCTRTHL